MMFVIIRSSQAAARFYINQVLDLHTRDANSRYNSIVGIDGTGFILTHYVFTYLYNWCVNLISLSSYVSFLSS